MQKKGELDYCLQAGQVQTIVRLHVSLRRSDVRRAKVLNIHRGLPRMFEQHKYSAV